MIAIAKVADDKFRKDMFKSKRKPIDEIWNGEHHREIGKIVSLYAKCLQHTAVESNCRRKNL